MDTVKKELFKNEVKSWAYRRAIAKKRAKQLRKESSAIYSRVLNDSASGKLTGSFWEDNRFKVASKKSNAASSLDSSTACNVRHVNLAYGLLRNVPYKSMERSCREAPQPDKVLFHIHKYCELTERKNWDIKKVTKLLR